MTAIRVRKVLLAAALAAGLVASLNGCALVLIGGAAAGGTLIATDRRTLGAQTEDREIEGKAISQLNGDLPDKSHVDVMAFNRRVLLTGEVPDERTKQYAEAIVRGINNV